MRGLDEKVFVYYQHHPQDFADDLEALDDLTGCLGNDRRRPMDELDGSLEGYSPTDMMALAFYSWDEQCKGPFDPGRDYFCWNSRNGLVSTNNRDYRSDHLVDDIVVKIIKNATHLQLSKGVQGMINGWSEMRNLNKELFDFYQDHPNDFADDLEALDRLNYYLGNERRRPMPELDDLFGYKSVSELLALGGHSHDEDGGQFDPSHKYFYLSNGVVSTDFRDYRKSYLNENVGPVTVANELALLWAFFVFFCIIFTKTYSTESFLCMSGVYQSIIKTVLCLFLSFRSFFALFSDQLIIL